MPENSANIQLKQLNFFLSDRPVGNLLTSLSAIEKHHILFVDSAALGANVLDLLHPCRPSRLF